MPKKTKKKTYTATWTAELNPLYFVVCPHCKADIIMSAPSTIERLKRWAIKLLSK